MQATAQGVVAPPLSWWQEQLKHHAALWQPNRHQHAAAQPTMQRGGAGTAVRTRVSKQTERVW